MWGWLYIETQFSLSMLYDKLIINFLFTTSSVYPEDMEFGKYRRKFFKKYFSNIDKYIEDVDAFNDVNSDYWDVISGQVKINVDNKPNIRKWNSEKNEYDFYSSNSKHWSFVDPHVKDSKSIQYSSKNNCLNIN